LTEADEKLRAAQAASAERLRLIGIREALAPDLEEAEADATKLEATLEDERRDVRRYERGVWAFLYDLFADREARLTKEQREAVEAEARWRDGAALRDRLREEVASLGTRIDILANADTELATARMKKHEALLASGGPAAQELDGIGTQLGAIGVEAQAVDEALGAGDRAVVALAQLGAVLDSARNWGVADLMTDSFLVSWAKRNKLDEARSLAGAAQAEISVFRRELADVGVSLLTEIEGLADHHRFLDTWFDNIFSDFSVQGRINDARTTTESATQHVRQALEGLRARRAALTARHDTLMKQQLDLLDPR
jgi:hypothetical protein